MDNIFEKCPVKVVMSYLGKRWTIDIIRDLMLGNKRFSDFLHLNTGLSNKILAQRLKELENSGIIQKNISNSKPLIIEYELTEKGMQLNYVLYELAMFSFTYHKDQIFVKEPLSEDEFVNKTKKLFFIKT